MFSFVSARGLCQTSWRKTFFNGGNFMKMFMLLVASVFAFNVYAADPTPVVKGDVSPEARQQMADAHQKMADCLKSSKPIQDCRADFMKSMKDHMGHMGPMGHMGHHGKMEGCGCGEDCKCGDKKDGACACGKGDTSKKKAK
jgi:hypothetical protein